MEPASVTKRLKLDSIVVDHTELINPKTVEALAESMKENGLIHSITVTRINGNGTYKLRVGRHRYAAAKLLQWPDIDSKIVNIDELRCELIAIDENLIRNEIHHLERGAIFRKRKEIYEALHPETKEQEKKKKGAVLTNAKLGRGDAGEMVSPASENPSFVEDTARKTGYSKRTIQHDIQLDKNLDPEVKRKVKELNLPKREELKLARLDSRTQRQIVERLIGQESADVDKALREIKMEELKNTGKALDDLQIMEREGYEPKTFDVWNFSMTNQLLQVETDANVIPPGIIFNLLYYYSSQGDTVIEPVSLDTLTADICNLMQRKCITFKDDPKTAKPWKDITEKARLIILNTTSSDITDSKDIKYILKHASESLKPGGCLSTISQNQDSESESQYKDRAFEIWMTCHELKLNPVRRISAPLNVQYWQSAQINKARKDRSMLGLVRDILIAQKR